MKTSVQLHKTIMRRVYYACAIRLATHTVTQRLVLLAVLGFVLTKLVFVSRVFENLASRELAELLPTAVRIAANADLLTLAVTGLAIMTAFSLPVHALATRRVSMQFA